LGVGEALVSTLDEKGAPRVVERVKIAPPRCRMGPITDQERQAIMSRSPVSSFYEQSLDRESAHEKLQQRATEMARQKADEQARLEAAEAQSKKYRGRSRDTYATKVGKDFTRKFTTKVVNGLWKALFGKRR